MTRQVEVVYESGVLRPTEPLPFAERQRLVATVTHEVRSPAPFNARAKEREWLRVNSSRYAGKWLVIEGDALIAEGSDALVVLQRARQQGIAVPFLIHVPVEPRPPFGGW